ncbi:hypothetical protein DB29_01301 [Shouchella clausii]|nr:hypothetical protein DB29_01301 [Shouchella clausii]
MFLLTKGGEALTVFETLVVTFAAANLLVAILSYKKDK